MNRGSTTFLRISVFLIGIIVITLSIFLLPRLANEAAEIAPDLAYLKYLVLIGLYVTTIPFFFALYQALKILTYIDNHNAFSCFSVKSLKNIVYCAITISVFYIIGGLFLFIQNALHPGIAIMGLTITFASTIIAVFASTLKKLIKNAIDMKSENDLTV
ncbi:DUF2975 domain-containing protein [Oceanobacillus chungangensis]|uniref:DUF2975 domain-containing protein n=1 Tax=Oceanobacillus chungangensis TaxID=1229152 RepID=A0A3D8PZA8_9BACI|nr:DUF2975 domain-containing protein [Oceanobacillus chungangensis]RDW20499.1 DUF2975 domain-containing protein [Oceanobacillus chungangensis]